MIDFEKMSLIELGQLMMTTREELDDIKQKKTDLEKKYEVICKIMANKIEDAGLQNFRLACGKGIRVQDEMFVSVGSEQFDDFKNWLIAQGDAGIIKETVHNQTLTAYVKGRLREGKELPPTVKVTIVPKARFF